jgi:hypothetical protein
LAKTGTFTFEHAARQVVLLLEQALHVGEPVPQPREQIRRDDGELDGVARNLEIMRDLEVHAPQPSTATVARLAVSGPGFSAVRSGPWSRSGC